MNLKSFGCSFIYGSELSDEKWIRNPMLYTDIIDNKDLGGSRSTWPALYAKSKGYTYQCYAFAGSGNLQILDQILNQSTGNDNDMYIIGWSWIDRFDYTASDWYPAGTNNPKDRWYNILPGDDTEKAKIYYRDLHSEYRDKFTNLCYIKIAIDTLKQKNIPFIMTYIDELLFDQQWHTSPAVIELQNYIKPYMTRFENKNFLEWSQRHNYHISDNGHPLEQAHKAAAEYIQNLTGIVK